MGNYEVLKSAIIEVIKTNGNQEITGIALQNVLTSIVSSVGKNATFAGIAEPGTVPGEVDQNVFYLAFTDGTYAGFNNYSLSDKVVIFSNTSGQWVAKELPVPTRNEFIKRVQGTSENVDPRYETKYLGNFDNVTDFVKALDSLTYDTQATGFNMGVYRAQVNYRTVEVKNILLSSSLNVITQVIYGTFTLIAKVLVLTDNNYSVIWRKHENNAWGDWKIDDSALSEADAARLGACFNNLTSSYSGDGGYNIDFISTNSSLPRKRVTIPPASISNAGLMLPSEKARLNNMGTILTVVWTETSDINGFTNPGTYYITGERLSTNDGLPIGNSSPGHTIAARLIVLDSSIAGTGDSQDKCITQILMLSNRTGQDGDIYIRTGSAYSLNVLQGGSGWEPWGKLQQNIEVGQVASLDGYTDNGIYSGVYTDGSSFVETFVMVVINNYAAAGAAGAVRSISQFKYALNVDGSVSYKTRVGQGNTGLAWDDWADNGGGSEVDITDAVKAYGLPALISQGFAKEGVTYVVNFSPTNGIISFDVNGKIGQHMEDHRNDLTGKLRAYIKVINESIVIDYFPDNNYDRVQGYYRYIMDFTCKKVCVSADMTEL